MARLVRDSRLESREARSRLKIRKEPYWKLISEGIHLGYYRGDRGGMWHARVRTTDGKKYVKSALGKADDFAYAYADGEIALSFSQAQEQARKFAELVLRGENNLKPYTVQSAINDYLTDFKASGKKSNDYLFTRADSSQWKKNYQIRPLTVACEIAKIEPAISFHDLRHTYASALAMNGVPLQVIAAELGHADTRVTHKHYAHLMPSYIADVIRQHMPNFGKTKENNVKQL